MEFAIFGSWTEPLTANSIFGLEGPIAQRLEQATHNRLVAGSNPAGPTSSETPAPERFRRWPPLQSAVGLAGDRESIYQHFRTRQPDLTSVLTLSLVDLTVKIAPDAFF